MTHEELLAKINDAGMLEGFMTAAALRAVVELHKPLNNDCSECVVTEDWDGNSLNHTYPCPTIQAIEKELQ